MNKFANPFAMIVVSAGLGFMMTHVSVKADDSIPVGLASQYGVTAQELFFRYYPDKGYVHIKEYNLSVAGDPAAVSIADIRELIAAADYCDYHFSFEFLESVEERIYADRDAITSECHLFVKSHDVAAVMQDILSGILERPVGAGIKEAELSASFDAPDINLADNNSEGMYGKNNRRMIVWQIDKEYYEAIWQVADWPASAVSVSELLEEDLVSPVVSAEALDKIKQDLLPPKTEN